MSDGKSGANVHWSRKQLLDAIDRCETEVARMIEQHATVEEIERRRKGIDMLWKWAQAAEE